MRLQQKPLFHQIRKTTKFNFGKELNSFELLNKKLSKAPVLVIYSSTAYTELHTYASASGYGAILFQRQNDCTLHPTFYYSKRPTDAESKYHSFELEALAIVYALERFRIYLQGIPLVIISDSKSFKQTIAKKDLNPRIARWALILQKLRF